MVRGNWTAGCLGRAEVVVVGMAARERRLRVERVADAVAIDDRKEKRMMERE